MLRRQLETLRVWGHPPRREEAASIVVVGDSIGGRSAELLTAWSLRTRVSCRPLQHHPVRYHASRRSLVPRPQEPPKPYRRLGGERAVKAQR
jgi:hypothetical protein